MLIRSYVSMLLCTLAVTMPVASYTQANVKVGVLNDRSGLYADLKIHRHFRDVFTRLWCRSAFA